jgi:two-component system nitrate/nitrite sensor histidine kinase NarX
MAQGGMTPDMVEKLYCIPEDFPIFAEISKKKAPAVKIPLKFVQDLGYKKTIFIPLVAGDTIVGSIDLPTKRDYVPNDDECRWFALVGRMLGSMIYQAQLSERLQNMAVIQERTRLSNELHDDFSQLVRSMKWGLEEARIALEYEQMDKTDRILENLEDMVQNTATYLREEMLSLRETVDPNQGINPILERMLLRFERNWGIKTKFATIDGAAANQNQYLSSKVVVQLIRIVQEALMNVRRHSNAQTVTIEISEETDRMVYTITDDGIGFDLEDIPQESLGLRVIRERAGSVGATIRIDSVEGSGTILKIGIPRLVGAPR